MKKYFKKIFILFVAALFIIISNAVYCLANELNDAEKLYTKINEFLSEHNDIEPEDFDGFCRKFMLNSNQKSFGSKEIFEDNIILYRGVNDKKFAEEFKNGNIFIASNLKNVRGCGIYTTTNLDLARSYTDKISSECIIKMTISKSNVKILENDYLEKLKSIIIEKYPNEFGEFKDKAKDDYIFDSMKDFLDEQTKLIMEECMKIEDPEIQDKFLEEKFAKMRGDTVIQKLQAKRKKYFKTNKSAVWYNSGLLTKLFGFDALYANDYLSDFIDSKQDEYLIVNPGVLNIVE